LQEEYVEGRLVRLEQALGNFRATRKPIGKIQRARNHDLRVRIFPEGRRRILERDADPQFERG